MKNKLYYTVEKQTVTFDTLEECTGWKNIQVYEIINDRPKQWFEIETENENSPEKEVQDWLDNNGFSGRDYDMIWL